MAKCHASWPRSTTASPALVGVKSSQSLRDCSQQNSFWKLELQQNESNQTEKIEDAAKDDIRWQLEDLVFSMKQSKASMVKEQEELQWKIDRLKGLLGGEHSARIQDDLSSL